MTRLPRPTLRTLLALAAATTLAAAAQASPIYFTFQGQIAAEGRGWGSGSAANAARNSPGNGLADVITPIGTPFSFTLGLDNGGSSVLGQTWTADHLRSMRMALPTVLGQTYHHTLLFGGTTGINLQYINQRQGSLATDAQGQVTSVFSALGFVPTRNLRPFDPTPEQNLSNGLELAMTYDFGLLPMVSASDPSLVWAWLFNGELVNANSERVLRGTPLGMGYGAGAGLTNPGQWFVSNADGAPLANAVPEPSAWALTLLALGAMLACSRRPRAAGAVVACGAMAAA